MRGDLFLEIFRGKGNPSHERGVRDGLLYEFRGGVVFAPLVWMLQQQKIGVRLERGQVIAHAVCARPKAAVAGGSAL